MLCDNGDDSEEEEEGVHCILGVKEGNTMELRGLQGKKRLSRVACVPV